MRYVFPAGDGLKWELDQFFGANDGLYVAEIEMPTEDTPFDIPDWLGEEVTYLPEFTNVALAREPFFLWPTAKRDAVLRNRVWTKIERDDMGIAQPAEVPSTAKLGTKLGEPLSAAEDVAKLRNAVTKLYDILDDIDTASDMFKPQDLVGYRNFYNYAMSRIERRGETVTSDGHSLFLK